jgi:hypothetical protein
MKVKEAYELAGYSGGKSPMHDVRRHPAVNARIEWLLEYRVRASAQASIRPEKNKLSRQEKILRELDRIAFGDVRSLVRWEQKAQLDQDGNVVGVSDVVSATPSDSLSRDAAALVKSVTTKSGALKIDTHDKLAALQALMRHEGMGERDAAPPVTVNNSLTIQGDSALEHVRRLSFMLAAADQMPRPAPPLTIEAQAVEVASEPPAAPQDGKRQRVARKRAEKPSK